MVTSMLIDGCIDNAKDYYEQGPEYTVVSPHAGGVPDTGNCLYAINEIVFEQKKIALIVRF